eukprot:SAG31_NODE_6688_length_1924_cov_3.074521_1_plen_165_part_00
MKEVQQSARAPHVRDAGQRVHGCGTADAGAGARVRVSGCTGCGTADAWMRVHGCGSAPGVRVISAAHRARGGCGARRVMIRAELMVPMQSLAKTYAVSYYVPSGKFSPPPRYFCVHVLVLNSAQIRSRGAEDLPPAGPGWGARYTTAYWYLNLNPGAVVVGGRG